MLQATAAPDPLKQLVADCRDQPVVFDNVCPDLCAQLEYVILARMQNDRGRRTGSLNVGGWKSGEDFFSWPDAAVQELRQVIAELVGARSPVGLGDGQPGRQSSSSAPAPYRDPLGRVLRDGGQW